MNKGQKEIASVLHELGMNEQLIHFMTNKKTKPSILKMDTQEKK